MIIVGSNSDWSMAGALSSVSMAHVFPPPTSPVSNRGLGAHGKTEESGLLGRERNRGRENREKKRKRHKTHNVVCSAQTEGEYPGRGD